MIMVHLGTLERPPLNLENKDMLNYTVVSVSFPNYTPIGSGERRENICPGILGKA